MAASKTQSSGRAPIPEVRCRCAPTQTGSERPESTISPVWRKAKAKCSSVWRGRNETASAISGSRKSSSWCRRNGCWRSCRSTEERAKAVVRGPRRSRDVLQGKDPRLMVVVGPCSVHDPKAAMEYATQAAATARALQRRPAGRDAGLLREAADDDRLEGPDQRPPPGRMRRRQRRPADRPQAAAGGARPRAADRLRVPRPDHAAVHLRLRRLGGDRGPHLGEPDPPPARLRPLDADRLQEPDRRQHPGRGRRGAGGGGSARLRRDRRRRHAGDPAHDRQPRLPHHPPRRPRDAELPPARGRGRAGDAAASPACRSGW